MNLKEDYPDLLYIGADEKERKFLDKAIIGVGERCRQPPVLIYDYWRLVAALELMNGWVTDEAAEWIDHNCANAWVGPSTPIIMHRVES